MSANSTKEDTTHSSQTGSSSMPSQPVKPKTAFQLFQKARMPRIKAELARERSEHGEGIELGAIMKEVSRQWQQAEKEEKQEFIDAAACDKERYEKECYERDQVIEADRKRKRDSFSSNTIVEGKRERKRHPALDLDSGKTKLPKDSNDITRTYDKVRSQSSQKLRQEREKFKAQVQHQKDNLAKNRAEIASARLKYLLSQSDLFAHFSKQLISKGKKTEGNKKKGQSLQEVDDENPFQEKEHVVVHITQQPSIIDFGTMRAYQLEGLNWMVNLAHQGINGILADEMGLGKTLQTISVLAYFYQFENISGPHIVLVPKSTLSNWMMEFHRWCPSLRVVKLHGNKQERKDVIQDQLCPGSSDDTRPFDVCVTTFEMCMKERTALCKFAWRYLIIDEAHRIKNEASQFAKVVRLMDTEYRLLLTGTPLQNNLHELWALLNFLLPDVFASSEEFDEWFNLDVDDDEAKKQMIGQLHKILRPFMLRRLKADVEKSLPPKKETLLFVGMSLMQKTLYKSLLLRDMDTITGKVGAGVSRSALQNIVMQLRKCCGHPYLFEGQEDRTLDPLGEHVVENCGKMVLLDKLLKKLKQRGSRVLLFTQMTRVLDIFEDFCRMRRYDYCRIDGRTSYEDRESAIESYNEAGSSKFVFLLSTRAGGLGINLYTADIVILYDSDWNPQADLQAQDRAHRIGQKKEVNVYRFVTSDSVEEKIIERAQQKLKLDAMVVQQGRLQDKQSKLSKSDMLEMIRFGADQVFRTTDSTITDEDIDAILAKGEQRTEEMKQKLQTHDKGDMLDFKLDGGKSMQSHDGVDYSKEKERQEELKRLAEAELARTMAQSIGKRERRAVLRQSQLMGNGRTDHKVKLLPKALRLPRMDDWQFYNRKRLTELHEIQVSNYEDAKIVSGDKPPLPPHAMYLSPKEQEEKDRLLSQAFGDWNKPQFFLFVRLLARYGRGNLETVAQEMGRPLEEIQRYVGVFNARGPRELHDWARIIKSIEKGESKLLEIERLSAAVRAKLARYNNPMEEMTISYQGKIAKVFTEEEDRALLCCVERYGYGAWEKIRRQVASLDRFAFDYYLRSRNATEIGRRCDSLMRNCEKENADMRVRESKDVALRVELEKERVELNRRLIKAKHDLHQRQKRVKELILKEAKRMKAQRAAKRAKKRKERDQDQEQVNAFTEQLVTYLQNATTCDAAKLAMDFCADVYRQHNLEIPAAHVLQRIRQIAKPLPDGDGYWEIDQNAVRLNVKDVDSESNDAMEIDSNCKDSPPSRKPTRVSEKNPILFNEFNIRLPRSAYVLFAIDKMDQVKTSMIAEGDPPRPSTHTPSPLQVLHQVQRIWSSLSEEQVAFWKEREIADRQRYEMEMKDVTKSA
ncbi:unnamed protein product [Albugo candida]|uniref:Chromatin-remodeling complex ATPase chain n=1 Tax=Albugo candida TaxID=65357 RepID=A0A024GSP4_9STRA|nr:unnamed protein product [Albugo candida]|eukprot:CCI49756.1 unnamed protein product [Albugo candida]